MTARWVVDEVAPKRDLRITWQPISLLFKNEMTEADEPYPRYLKTHKMLRVCLLYTSPSPRDRG